MSRTADLIVVGLGAAGSASLYQAARRGARVIGLDRHRPPHDQGSSHGETRITRQAIGEGEEYVPLALRAQVLWREIEAQTGESLFAQVGCLTISRPGLGAVHHGKPDFLERALAAAFRFGIAHEVLERREIHMRWENLNPGEGEVGYFEPGAGMVFPERCIAAQLTLAERHGATIVAGETVTAIEPRAGGVRVVTDLGVYEADQVVVSAGAWAPDLLGGWYQTGLAIHRQTLHWFRPDEPAAFTTDRFPVFIWMHGSGEGDWFYGFPIVPGGEGVKLASEQFAISVRSPDELDRTVTRGEALTMFARHVPGRIAGLAPSWLTSKTCIYTTAPDSRFVVGRDPERERIIVVSACSGHGFKHSPAIGEAVAALALTGEAPSVLGPFDPALLRV